MQQCKRYHLPLINIFLDYVTVFDSVERRTLWRILLEDVNATKIGRHVGSLLQRTCIPSQVHAEESSSFVMEWLAKQGCKHSPVLFSSCFDWILDHILRIFEEIVLGRNGNLTGLDHTDNVKLLVAVPNSAHQMFHEVPYSQLTSEYE